MCLSRRNQSNPGNRFDRVLWSAWEILDIRTFSFLGPEITIRLGLDLIKLQHPRHNTQDSETRNAYRSIGRQRPVRQPMGTLYCTIPRPSRSPRLGNCAQSRLQSVIEMKKKKKNLSLWTYSCQVACGIFTVIPEARGCIIHVRAPSTVVLSLCVPHHIRSVFGSPIVGVYYVPLMSQTSRLIFKYSTQVTRHVVSPRTAPARHLVQI